MDTIYIEKAIREHPRVEELLQRFPASHLIECERYGEVFNPAKQNFRLQKKRPALILAEKHGNCVHPTPPNYTIGRKRNFYFSHMLNCLYDCRYCFLQGMFRSANYVYFVNFDKFEDQIEKTVTQHPDEKLTFFSGYDCDSLALEGITGFAESFLPFFQSRPNIELELRTKSVQTKVLENRSPSDSIVVAYTLTPDEIAQEVEHGAPPLHQRLNRVRSLTQQGWMVGYRLDPLLPWPNFEATYSEFLDEIFRDIDTAKIHSVTLGSLRFPRAMYERIVKMYPHDRLFALAEMEKSNGQMGFREEIENELIEFVESHLRSHIASERIFRQ